MGIGVLWGRAGCGTMPPIRLAAVIDSVTETSAVWAPVPEEAEAGTQDAAGIYAQRAVDTSTAWTQQNREAKNFSPGIVQQLDFVDIVE